MSSTVPFKAFDRFIYRIPLLPFNFTGDSNFLQSDIFKESIYIASRDLYDGLSQDSNEKLASSLYKYLNRMKFRCTPFGIFAGLGVGKVGATSRIELDGTSRNRTRTRLDMNFLCALCQQISEIEEFNDSLRYFPNTSLYRYAGGYRYIEYKYVGPKRKHYLAEVEQTDYLEQILIKAGPGVLKEELIQFLTDEGFDKADAVSYLTGLIKNQVIVTELDPSVTGDDLLQNVIKKVTEVQPSHQVTKILKSLQEALDEIDSRSLGRSISLYETLEAEVKKTKVPYERKFLFQSDMFTGSAVATIDKGLVNQVLEGFHVLNKLTVNSESPQIVRFREDFYKRFEEEEVPLVEVFDSDLGIGFATSTAESTDVNELLRDIPNFSPANQNSTAQIDAKDNFLIEKYFASLSEKKHEIVLEDEEIEPFPETWSDVPPTMSCMVDVINVDCKDGEPGLQMSSIFSTGANLISRFSHIDETVSDVCQEIIEKEEELIGNDKIVAEVVHLPESRIGNILYRPSHRKFEIPFLAKASVEFENQVPITDIMVSLRGKEIFLRSVKFNKRIIPRLTSAHNYQYNSLPLYRFLCLMQNQGLRSGLSFRWPSLLSAKPFLPRVRYKNLVLEPARWNIKSADLISLSKQKGEEFQKSFQEFKMKMKLVNLVLVVEGDNKLLIDLSDSQSVQFLINEYKAKNIVLEEMLLTANNPLVVSANGNIYNNQLLMSFYRDNSN